jgi:hypothetical protein
MSRVAVLAILVVGALGACVPAWAQAEAPPKEGPNVTDAAGAADLPQRAVLDDVPRVGYDIHLCPFPGSLYACMAYLGDPCDYDYLMGVTGAAFRRFFEKDDGGNVDLMYLQPEPHERAFAALGYQFQTVPRTDKAGMIQAVKDSIARGRPVLAFVLLGPPECAVVTGYDQDGEVLIGWSYFQEQRDRYHEATGWFENASPGPPVGMILIEAKEDARPSDREVLISSLKWAVDLARTPRRPDRPNHASGLAAYDAWADALEVDADYPADDAGVMATRAMVHGDQCVMLEERNNAAAFLRQMAPVIPEITGDLLAAADLYEEVAGFLPDIWRGGMPQDPEAQRWLADPAVRREIAGAVRAARDKEAQAVGELEKALAEVEGAGAEAP